ncbi:MAG: hypothetical protein ACRYFX_23630 [Janthinobacterium lividum]
MRETRQEGVVNREPRFRVKSIETASLGTLDVLPLKQPGDMTLPRRDQLIAGFVRKNLPLKMSLSLNTFNPNLESAFLTSIDYTVLVDGKTLGVGRLMVNAELPANDSITLPLAFELNTYPMLDKAYGEDALPALRNFALGFGDPHRERVVVRVRPIIRSQRGKLSTLIHRRQPIVLAQEVTIRRQGGQRY